MVGEYVEHTVTVPLPQGRAFERFTDGLSGWWPSEYTWAQSTLETIAIEPAEGGHCFEVGPHGFHCDWGRVLAWQPPERLVLSWQIGPARVPEPDPERSSEVEVTFASGATDATEVTLRHHRFGRHGEGSSAYRDAMASAEGWPWILERFAEVG